MNPLTVHQCAALWRDEEGAVITVELIIILTVLVLALVVGFTALRDALVTEFGDMSGSIGSLNQSYSYGGIIGHCAYTAGSFFFDLRDVVDDDLDRDGASGGILVCAVVATPEGGLIGGSGNLVAPQLNPSAEQRLEAQLETAIENELLHELN